MSKKGNNKETPEWVDSDNVPVNAAKNKFTLQEPQQNTPKVLIIYFDKENVWFISCSTFFNVYVSPNFTFQWKRLIRGLI